MLAMLHALVAAASTRSVLWLHGARDREHHAFAEEVRALMRSLARGRSHVCYSQPGAGDEMGRDFDAVGRLSPSVLDDVAVSRDADVHLCGPTRFMVDMKRALLALGVAPDRGVTAHWKTSAYASLLELAEACDVPVRWSCRTGVCHSCESGLISGTVAYSPKPLDDPASGNLLVCCSQPQRDVVIDL